MLLTSGCLKINSQSKRLKRHDRIIPLWNEESFEEHYVTIPEEKYNVFESMVEKLDDMETKLNEQIEKNITLNARLSESAADGILNDVSEGLAQTQKEKACITC